MVIKNIGPSWYAKDEMGGWVGRKQVCFRMLTESLGHERPSEERLGYKGLSTKKLRYEYPITVDRSPPF